jgi:hypothetical protein
MHEGLTPEQRALLDLYDRLAALEEEVRVLRRRDITSVFRRFAPPWGPSRIRAGGFVWPPQKPR